MAGSPAAIAVEKRNLIALLKTITQHEESETMKKPVCSQTTWVKPTATLGALAAAISGLYAPETFSAEANARQLDEVVVSARRREEMAQDVPISMTVMTEEFLKTNNITKVQDLGTKVPSMRITQAGGSLNEPVITLRGQRQGEASFNQDPAAPIYFNEVVISPNQGGNLGLYDLEGLQVLKGPQGTLFGRNSTGGAVLMTSKRPGNTLGGYVEAKVGDYNLTGFEGAVDVPLNDQLTTRLVAHKLDRDGYQENIADNALHGRRYRDEHSEGGRLSVNFEDGAFSTLNVFSYDENKTLAAVPVIGAVNHQVGLGAIAAYQPLVAEQIARDNPWKVKSDIDASENVRNIFFSNASEYAFTDDLNVKNVFGYRKVFLANSSDIDGTAIGFFGAVSTPHVADPRTPGTGVTFSPRMNSIDTEFYSDELQLFGSALDHKLDWITGLYWSQMAGTEDKLVQQSPGIPSSTNPNGKAYDSGLNDILNTSYGVFAESTYAFTDEWALTAGMRESKDYRELTVRKWNSTVRNDATCGLFAEGITPALQDPLNGRSNIIGDKAPGCERTVDDSFEKPTWKLSLNYKPEVNTLVYGNISTGYRAGGFNTRAISDSTLQPFDPESVTTYELGHKKDWDFNGITARTSVAAYWQNYEDIQNTVSFSEGGRLVTRTENAGKAEISGLEFQVTVKPTDDLTFDFSYSYVNAKYLKREATIRGNVVDTSGDDFTYIPMQSLTAAATYVLPLDAQIGKISLTAGAYWQDEMSTLPTAKELDLYKTGANPNTTFGEVNWTDATVAEMRKFSQVDAYAVYNLRADWRGVMGSAFDVAAYVDNVTDEQYVLGGLNVIDSGGYGAYHYGDPRTIGASVKYSF
jgi:iron complex outermembrane receptor protein